MNLRLLVYCTIAASGGFLVGFDNTFIGAVPLLRDYFHLNDLWVGFISSIGMIGGLMGSLFSGRISYQVGTKRMFLVASALCAISAAGTALTSSVTMILFLRTCVGLSFGIFSTLPPIYLSEITPAEIRGRFVTLYQLLMVIGSMLSFIVMYGLVSRGAESWRYMVLAPVLLASLLFAALFFLPESPRWLARKGEHARAQNVLARVGGLRFAEEEMKTIRGSHCEGTREKISDLFSPKFRKVVIIGLLLAAFQQLTGISAVFNFAPIIFEKIGAGLDSSFFQTMLLGIDNFLFTLVGMVLVDRWGRKPLMIWGLLLCILSLGGLSAVFYLGAFSGLWALSFLLIFMSSFAFSAGPVMWVLISEIYPAQIKGLGTSTATFMMWIWVGITTFLFPIGLGRWGGGLTFALFAAVTVFHLIFIQLYIPETKNRRLEEIEEEMVGRVA
jgi:MFS transporter, SP family, arabinose:H+ symporter